MANNSIYCVKAVTGKRALPDACIPLTVTSPPYEGLRKFGGRETLMKLRTAHITELCT